MLENPAESFLTSNLAHSRDFTVLNTVVPENSVMARRSEDSPKKIILLRYSDLIDNTNRSAYAFSKAVKCTQFACF